jgi:hypothetical protein
MAHCKTASVKYLTAVSLLFTALPAMAEVADKVIDATKAGVGGDGATLNTDLTHECGCLSIARW